MLLKLINLWSAFSYYDSSLCRYCLDKVVFDASLIEWFCYECLQRRGEVTCVSSLEKVSSERPPSHAHSRSPVHQLITKSVESVRDAGPWRNRENESFATKYTSLNKIYSSVKKHTKKKSIMKPMGNCTNRKVRIAKVTTQAQKHHALVKPLGQNQLRATTARTSRWTMKILLH